MLGKLQVEGTRECVGRPEKTSQDGTWYTWPCWYDLPSDSRKFGLIRSYLPGCVYFYLSIFFLKHTEILFFHSYRFHSRLPSCLTLKGTTYGSSDSLLSLLSNKEPLPALDLIFLLFYVFSCAYLWNLCLPLPLFHGFFGSCSTISG